MFYLAILLIATLSSVETASKPDGMNSATVTQPGKLVKSFWTKEKLLAAKEVLPTVSAILNSTRKSIPDLSDDNSMIFGDIEENDINGTSKDRSARNQQIATTGRVFWSCSNSVLYSCSGSVIHSNSRNLIVTAGHCLFDTATLRWYTNCNWIFVPGYSNGNTPYGIYLARYFFTFSAYTQRYPNYNYDVGFVSLYPLNGVQIGNRISPQSIGFNYAYGSLTSSFGYPLSIGNGQTLQSCTNYPYNIPFYINNILYRGQALRYCTMGAGSGGGPWLQQFSSSTGRGITYSVNSFTLPAYPSTLFGPMFDTVVYNVWNWAQYY